MDYTKLFYWLTVADNAKTFFVAFVIIFTVISVISTICYFISFSDDNGGLETAICRKWMWYAYPFMILFWSLYVLTPSKRDALLIVAGGQTMNFLTTDSSAKQIPHELSNFIVTELKDMAHDTKVDLESSDKKQGYIDEAKKMTTEELLHRAKIDSAFKKAVLGD